jgi:hypothetical protein
MFVHARLLLSAAALAAAALVACQAPPADESSSDEGALTGQVRKGDELARCWTVSDGNSDEFFRSYELTCRVSSAGLTGLAGSSVYVDARGAGGNVLSGRPGETPDQDVVLGMVRKSDFPLSLRIYGSWASTRPNTISPFRITLAANESANASAPVIVKMPFDTWPITFLNRLSVAIVSSERYTVQAAPFKTSQDDSSTETTFTTSVNTGVVRGPRVSLDLIAPSSGSLALHLTGAADARTSITGPGTYVLDASGIRLATAAEEAEAGPAPDAGPGASADAAPPPPPDAAPAPTCGDPGQMHCTNAGSWSCNAGTRVDSGAGLCVACGNDGQTYCYVDPRNVSGSWRCNAGTRLDSSTNTCVACGSLGKTHCVTDPNNISGSWTCNPGLRFDSSGICVS